jgi:hypothetical protein
VVIFNRIGQNKVFCFLTDERYDANAAKISSTKPTNSRLTSVYKNVPFSRPFSIHVRFARAGLSHAAIFGVL